LKSAGPGASQVTIRANNARRIFNVGQNLTSVATSNLTVTNGNSTGGGGIMVNDGSTLTVTNVNITNNSTSGGGGGIGGFCTTTPPNPIIKKSTITGNTARGDGRGGGAFSESRNGPIQLHHTTEQQKPPTPHAA